MREHFLPLLLTAALSSSACARPPDTSAEVPRPSPSASLPPRPETPGIQEQIPIDLSKITEDLFLPYGPDDPWFLVYGPHYIGDNPVEPNLRNAIDIAAPEVVRCNPGDQKVLEERFVASASAGVIRIIGDEKNRNDPNHSMIWIETDFGVIFAYTHLADITKHLQVGDRVGSGEPLGNISCEHPPGGRTTGIHLHFAVYDKNFNPIPIEGLKLSDWVIKGGQNAGDGTMENGKEVRIADGRRCGTSQACGGLRNDIPHPIVLERP